MTDLNDSTASFSFLCRVNNFLSALDVKPQAVTDVHKHQLAEILDNYTEEYINNLLIIGDYTAKVALEECAIDLVSYCAKLKCQGVSESPGKVIKINKKVDSVMNRIKKILDKPQEPTSGWESVRSSFAVQPMMNRVNYPQKTQKTDGLWGRFVTLFFCKDQM